MSANIISIQFVYKILYLLESNFLLKFSRPQFFGRQQVS